MNLKIIVIWSIVVSALLCGAFGTKILSLISERDGLENKLYQTEKLLAEAKLTLTEQSKKIEEFKLSVEQKEAEAMTNLNNIQSKYNRLLKQSKEITSADKSCETQLQLIQDAWREFLK